MSVVEIPKIGTFKYNYIIDPQRKYDIVSIVLFRMPVGYKHFSSYINGIQKIIDSKLFNHFKLRLYFDDSIKKISEFKTLANELHRRGHQLVHYDCPDYKVDGFHDGTFGTFIRYIPLFDFSMNDTNIVYINDADIGELYHSKFINYFMNSPSEFMYLYVYVSFPPHIAYQKNYMLGGSKLISKIKFPQKLLLKFLTVEIYDLNKYFPIEDEKLKITTSRKHKTAYRYFFYGSDELFLARKIKPYLDKHKIKYTRFASILLGGFSAMKDKFVAPLSDKETSKYYSLIVETINETFRTQFSSFNKLFDYFDTKYDWKRQTNMHLIFKHLQKLLKSLYKKHPELIKPKDYELFIKVPDFIDETNQLEEYNF